MVCVAASMLGETFLPPRSTSIIINNSLPPSKAGNGTKLIKPKFMDIKAINCKILSHPRLNKSTTRLAIPTGPAKSVDTLAVENS